MNDFTGRTVLVTGSSRGVGRAIALRFAALGARVALNYAGDENAASKTLGEVRQLGSDAILIKADIARPAEVQRMFQQVVDQFGSIDVVVANAGVEVIDQPLLEATEEQFDRLFGVNTKGAFFSLQNAARFVADNGRIISIGSSSTRAPYPGIGLYGSSKMAANYLVGVLALELGHRGVTVNTILPTSIEGAGVYTDIDENDPFRQMMATFRPLGGRLGRPDDVADAAEYFASDIAGWVSGQQLLVSGGAQQ